MRLLLDEHYSPEIARQLRARGHDVLSVRERQDLAGLKDADLFARVVSEGRAILTNNVGDFMPLSHQLLLGGEGHFGLLFTSDKSLPRRKDTIGQYVRVLDQLLTDNPGEDACRNRILWLP